MKSYCQCHLLKVKFKWVYQVYELFQPLVHWVTADSLLAEFLKQEAFSGEQEMVQNLS